MVPVLFLKVASDSFIFEIAAVLCVDFIDRHLDLFLRHPCNIVPGDVADRRAHTVEVIGVRVAACGMLLRRRFGDSGRLLYYGDFLFTF